MVLNKEVFIKCYGAGQNNRILAVVYVDRKNVNLKLIKGDLSEVHQGSDPPEINLNDPAIGGVPRIKLKLH